MDIATDFNYLKHHLILLALVVALAFGGIYGIESLIARHDAVNAQQQQAALAAQVALVQSLQQQISHDEQVYAAQNAALAQTISGLANAISTRDKQNDQQKQKDATLTAQEAAARLSEQTKAQPGEVTAVGTGGSIDLPISRQVVASLDQLTTVTADLADTKTSLANETTIAGNNAAETTGQKQLVGALQTQIVDADKACKAEVASVKADARKSKFKWFLGGFIAGVVTGHLFHL